MILRSLCLFFAVFLMAALGQFEIPGRFGKITSRPKAGDLAPEISFTATLHSERGEPWSSANLNGRLTVITFLPYVSGNPDAVNQWNAVVDQFAGKPVQFIWMAGEDEAVLRPFLEQHPVKGWMFNDQAGATGRAYGQETPNFVFIAPDRRILGYSGGFPAPEAEVVTAALEDRIVTMPAEPTLDVMRALGKDHKVMLAAEPSRMARPDDHRPDFPPSYAVHIAPAKDKMSGGNFASMDFWSLKAYTAKRVLAEMLDVNPIRIELPDSIDPRAQYDISIVLPQAEDTPAQRDLIRRGVEEYFHLEGVRENRLRDVYVLTAPEPKLKASSPDSFGGGGGFSFGDFEFTGNLEELFLDRVHDINSTGSVALSSTTIDEFCHLVEADLDRPLINESKLTGDFDLVVQGGERAPGERPKHDFVERLRDQLGLAIAPAQRQVETMVYRQR